MKQILLKRMWTALVVALSPGFVPEASAQYLQIGEADFTKTFKLSQNPRINFNAAGGITVVDGEQSVDFAFAQIGKIKFMQGDPATGGIALPASADVSVSRDGDRFVFSDAASAAVYSMTGVKIMESDVSADSPLDISSLGRAIYLMSVAGRNNKSFTVKFYK